MAPAGPERLRFTKHEGAGNDFLVLLDPDDEVVLGDVEVRALCHRHRGVGADGVIRLGPGRAGAEVSMVLHNAGGDEAEMSGNGIRCLAQAAVDAGLVAPPWFAVATGAGIRWVEYQAGGRPSEARASVDMGPVRLGEDQVQATPERRVRAVDVGNPHLVLLGPDPAMVDVAELGPKIQAVHPGGINVEFIALAPCRDELALRVWERGVGETLACGTGSLAAAAAARSWGLVGDRVRVHNPGGTLEVVLAPGGGPAILTGPVRRVAEVVVERSSLG